MSDETLEDKIERLRIKSADFLRRHPGGATFAPHPQPELSTGCARPISGKSFTRDHYACIYCDARRHHAIRLPVTAVSWFRHKGITEPTCADVMAMLP